MKSKQGIAAITALLILVIISAGVAYGAYLMSQKVALAPFKKPVNKEVVSTHEEPSPSPSVSPSLLIPSLTPGPSTKPSPSPKPSASPSSQPALTINFTQTGNIQNWDSRTESYTENWTLLYEEPGNPAVVVNLIFDQQSQCDLGAGFTVCDKSKLTNGDWATIEGNKQGDRATVIKLKKI